MITELSQLTTLPTNESIVEKANEILCGKAQGVLCEGTPASYGKGPEFLCFINIYFVCDHKALTEELRAIKVDYGILMQVSDLIANAKLRNFEYIHNLMPVFNLLSGKTNDYNLIQKLKYWLKGDNGYADLYGEYAIQELCSLKVLLNSFSGIGFAKKKQTQDFAKEVDNFLKVGEKIRGYISALERHLKPHFKANAYVDLMK